MNFKKGDRVKFKDDINPNEIYGGIDTISYLIRVNGNKNEFVVQDKTDNISLLNLLNDKACFWMYNDMISPLSDSIAERPSKDEYYLGIAKAVSARSTCLRRHYGAVIVKDDEIISTGYNGRPRGDSNCCDLGYCVREKEGHAHNDGDYFSCGAVHSEQNAIISASRKEMIGSTLYLYGEEDGKVLDAEPCPICRALIKNAGIAKVVGSRREEE